MEYSAAKLALFFALATAMASTMSSAQNTPSDYVRLHNAARSAVGVGPVSWDNTVAAYAQRYADTRKGDCALVHSGGRYGENIFWGSAGADWTAASAVGSWTDEKKNYHHDGNRCDAGQVCGHYTQVVWRKSTAIGCARVVCDAGRGVFVVCSYNPPGNFNGESPY